MMTPTNHGSVEQHSHIEHQQEEMVEVEVAITEEEEVEEAVVVEEEEDPQEQQEIQTIETMAQS